MIIQDLNGASGSVQSETCLLTMFFKCIQKCVIGMVFLDFLNVIMNLGFVTAPK